MRIRVDLSRYDRNGMDWSPLSQPRWVGWRYENRAGKRIKPPRSPRGYASVTNPNTWGTRQQAETWENGRVGFVLGRIEEREEHICGIDLDGCLDDELEPNDMARQIIDRLNTYTEVSPSERGLHLLFTLRCDDIKALNLRSQNITAKGGHKGVALDIEGRYYTVTDNIFEGRRRMRQLNRDEMQWLLKLVPGEKKKISSDESRSNYAKRFVKRLLRHDASYDEITEKLLADPGRVGRWARTKGVVRDKREISRAIEQAEHELALEVEGRAKNGSVTFFADIEEERVDWVRPSVARGTVIMVAGNSGVGKSTLLYDLIAHITQGKPWPPKVDDEETYEPGVVLILNYEDPHKSVIKPRLRVAGADMTKIAAIDVVKDGEQERSFSIATDLALLREHIGRYQPVLVVIDPVSAFIGGHHVDRDHGRSGTDVRASLDPLARLAEEYSTTVILVSHFRKEGKGLNALHMIVDSQAYTALPRIVFLVGPDKNDDSHTIMVTAKNQFLPRDEWLSLGFRLINKKGVSKIVWDDDPVDMTAEQFITKSNGGLGRPPQLEVRTFLQELLQHGPVRVSKVRLDAESHGFGERTIYRAREELGVRRRTIDGEIHWELRDLPE